jgi:hypothetical protein
LQAVIEMAVVPRTLAAGIALTVQFELEPVRIMFVTGTRSVFEESAETTNRSVLKIVKGMARVGVL